MDNRRRKFLTAAGGVVAASTVARSALAALPEIVTQDRADTVVSSPEHDVHYTPVTTLNGWTLPWRLNEGVKEFHLVA